MSNSSYNEQYALIDVRIQVIWTQRQVEYATPAITVVAAAATYNANIFISLEGLEYDIYVLTNLALSKVEAVFS